MRTKKAAGLGTPLAQSTSSPHPKFPSLAVSAIYHNTKAVLNAIKTQMMPSEPDEQGISSSLAAHFFLAPARVVQMMLCCATFVSSQSCIYFFFLILAM